MNRHQGYESQPPSRAGQPRTNMTSPTPDPAFYSGPGESARASGPRPRGRARTRASQIPDPRAAEEPGRAGRGGRGGTTQSLPTSYRACSVHPTGRSLLLPNPTLLLLRPESMFLLRQTPCSQSSWTRSGGFEDEQEKRRNPGSRWGGGGLEYHEAGLRGQELAGVCEEQAVQTHRQQGSAEERSRQRPEPSR